MRRVYIVDDVLTTGATYLECVRLLDQLGLHQVQPLVLAWVPDGNALTAAAPS